MIQLQEAVLLNLWLLSKILHKYLLFYSSYEIQVHPLESIHYKVKRKLFNKSYWVGNAAVKKKLCKYLKNAEIFLHTRTHTHAMMFLMIQEMKLKKIVKHYFNQFTCYWIQEKWIIHSDRTYMWSIHSTMQD